MVDSNDSINGNRLLILGNSLGSMNGLKVDSTGNG